MAVLNVHPSTVIVGDNLDVMQGINDECVDLIATDPPFNSKRDYESPLGSPAAGAFFKDSWDWDDVDEARFAEVIKRYPGMCHLINAVEAAQGAGAKAYCVMMALRIEQMHRILKPTGSLYMHCNQDANFMLRFVLDMIFGRDGFRNEIVWCYTGPGSPKMRQFNAKHDTIFWYSKGDTWTFNGDDVRLPYKDPNQRPRKAFDTGNAFSEKAIAEMRRRGKIPETWWPQAPGNGLCIVPRSRKENTGFKTQKPAALYQRIIRASSNEGDVVFDPFCGCGTTLIAAAREKRKWVGIDMGIKATQLVAMRMDDETAQGNLGNGIAPKTYRHIHTAENGKVVEPLSRTDQGDDLTGKALDEELSRLYGIQKGHCAGCNYEYRFKDMTKDRIFPGKKGGRYVRGNIQLLCSNCNSTKGERPQEYLRASMARIEARLDTYTQ